MRDRKNSKRVLYDYHLLTLIPSKFRIIAWRAIKARWLQDLEEPEFASWFETNHILKHANFSAGGLDDILGMSTSNNPLEGTNPRLRKLVRLALKQLGYPRRLPGPVPAVFRALAQIVLPTLARRIQNEGWDFETVPKLNAKNQKSARELSNSNLFKEWNVPGVFFCKQGRPDGKLERLKTEDLRRLMTLYERLSRPGAKLTYEDFKLVATVRVTSANGCFPCHDWGISTNCYHCGGRSILLGETGDGNDLGRKKKRGRPRMGQRVRGGFKNKKKRPQKLKWSSGKEMSEDDESDDSSSDQKSAQVYLCVRVLCSMLLYPQAHTRTH